MSSSLPGMQLTEEEEVKQAWMRTVIGRLTFGYAQPSTAWVAQYHRLQRARRSDEQQRIARENVDRFATASRRPVRRLQCGDASLSRWLAAGLVVWACVCVWLGTKGAEPGSAWDGLPSLATVATLYSGALRTGSYTYPCKVPVPGAQALPRR